MPPTPIDPTVSGKILNTAQSLMEIPYRLDPPPDGTTTIDCSLYVLRVFREAGYAFSGTGVRTAEQIRAACIPLKWPEVEPGDLLFFEHTYEPNEPAGRDGHTASHIGVSLG